MESAKLLLEILESLLGPDGIGVLGKYELLDSNGDVADTAPSIQVRTATEEPVVRRMIPLSGIECTIEPIPDYRFTNHLNKGGNAYTEHTIFLDQHDPYGYDKMLDAVSIIFQHPSISPLKDPIMRHRIESSSGIIPARAMLKIPRTEYLARLF